MQISLAVSTSVALLRGELLDWLFHLLDWVGKGLGDVWTSSIAAVVYSWVLDILNYGTERAQARYMSVDLGSVQWTMHLSDWRD